MKAKDRGEKTGFEERLKILHAVGNELSRVQSVDGLCRRVVELGRSRLGFERLSIWFVDSDPDFITGSFGVDETGALRYERDERVPIDDDPAVKKLHRSKTYSILEPNVPLRDHKGTVVGTGSHAIAAIWTGEEVIGYLSTDNLLEKKPLTEEDREILELYAATFGHLYSLKRAEEALRAAYARLREIQGELTQCTRMALGGEIATGVVHEVKNPLAVILRGIEYLSDKVASDDKSVRSTLAIMSDAVRRADNVLMGMLDYSKLSKLDLTAQNLNSVIESSLELVKHQIEKYGIRVIENFKDDIPYIDIDKNKMEQVFINIFLNAVYSMTDGGALTIKTYSETRDDGAKTISAEVEDTGPGIPPDVLAKMFDPFVTTRSHSGGIGMGLSVVKNIMDLHKGEVRIENKKEGHGARVSIKLKV